MGQSERPGPAAGGTDPDDDRAEPSAEAIDHLQTAANEMIAAARSFLDAVEGVVHDRDAVATVVDTFSSVAQAAAQAASQAAAQANRANPVRRRPADDGHDEGDEPPGVQHIRVS